MQKIPLSPDFALMPERAQDDLIKLLTRNATSTFRVWNPMYVPYKIPFDFQFGNLGGVIIREIHYQWNSGNAANQNYYIIRKDNGQKVLLFSLKQGTWSGTTAKETVIAVPVELQVEASAFIFESNGKDDFPDWFELYGDFKTVTVSLPSISRSPLKNLCGVNTKMWDIGFNLFPEKEAPLKGMINRQRLYFDHSSYFDANNNLFEDQTWKPFQNLKKVQADGIDTQICYLSFPEYPFPIGATRNDPATYKAVADRIYKIAAWNKANGRPASAIEGGNELNNWYSGNAPLTYMDGNALGAFMSICYDGHKGKFPGTGAKAADDQIKVSMSGLATIGLEIWVQLKEWAIANRGYKADGLIDWPFDIYSFHAYPSLEGQRTGKAGGVCPEISVLRDLRKINRFRKLYAPNTKLHVGEWSGGDINADSDLNAPAYGKYSAQQTSAMWTVRFMMLMAETEMDANSYFRIAQNYYTGGLANINDKNGTIFETMALVRQEADGVKKSDASTNYQDVYTGINMHRTMTGDYMKQANDILFNAGYVFDSRLSDSPNVLKFTKGTSELYAIWETEAMTLPAGMKPQFTESTNKYSLAKSGKLYRFVDDLSGNMASENYSAGVQIDVGAKPVFVVVDSTVVVTPPPPPPPPPDPVVITKQVDRGYFTSPFIGKREYFLVYEDSNSNLTIKKANGKYLPI